MYRNTLTTITSTLALTLNLVFSQVVINEIHYNPSGAQGSDNDYEFMELYNAGTEAVDMSGWSFTQGVNHTFADGTTLAAGAYMIVDVDLAHNGGSLDASPYDPDGDGFHENGAQVVQWTSNNLSNGGEDIEIVDTLGTVIDFVDYEDGSNSYGDWGTAHDGGGASLELIDATSDNSLAENWQASWVVGGTPGAANSTEPEATVTTIYNIQLTTDPNGASPMVGQYVQTSGVITGVDRIGNNSAFTIQDGSGSWNGIYCWWAAPDTLVVGDAVTVRGFVTEYNGYGNLGDPDAGMTQLNTGRVISHDSEGNELPAAVVLDLEDVGDEQYEGVRVTTTGRVVQAAVCDSDAENYNYCEWRITNNLDASIVADTINVNDRFAVTTPALGTIATVTGPLNQWGGSSNSRPAWKIEPASEDDVSIACENADFTISIEMIDAFGDGWNGAMYTIYGPQFSVVGTGTLEDGSFGVDTYCLYEYNAFTVVVGGGAWDEEISFNIVDAFGNDLIFGGVANYGTFPPDPYYEFAVTGVNNTTGCMDPTAVNYDYSAAADDGSCYYYGEVCESPITLTGTGSVDGVASASGVADAAIDQFFEYTAAQTGNMTVSSVGQTDEDTYLVILSSCDIGYTYETDPYTGDTLYVTEGYEDILATNDDFDSDEDVYSSEATICVTAGETYLIGWIAMYYNYEDTFPFTIEETPDITIPINMHAFGYEDGIDVTWSQVPLGCAELAESASRSQGPSRISPLKAKPNARPHKIGKIVRDAFNPNHQERTDAPRVATVTRDHCDDGQHITFVAGGGSFLSEVYYEVLDSDDLPVLSVAAGSAGTPASVCLVDGDYTVWGYDDYGDSWNGNVLTATNDAGAVVFSMEMTTANCSDCEVTPSTWNNCDCLEGSFTLESSAVYGCMDPTALNYDETATTDDGSCYWTGDVCLAPIVAGSDSVIDGTSAWYSVDIPATAGALFISDGSYGEINVYASCNYGDGEWDAYFYEQNTTDWIVNGFASSLSLIHI